MDLLLCEVSDYVLVLLGMVVIYVLLGMLLY